MTLNDAMKIFTREYPDYRILGYWQDAHDYIFNIEVSPDYVGAAQFIVKSNGKIQGTNPMNSNLDPKKYVKL